MRDQRAGNQTPHKPDISLVFLVLPLKTMLTAVPQKHRIPIWPSDSTSRCSPTRIENKSSNWCLQTNIHRNITHDGPKMETAQMSINRYADKHNVVHPHNGVVFSHEKEWRTDTGYYVDEPWNNDAEWKMSVNKRRRLQDSISMKGAGKTNPQRQKIQTGEARDKRNGKWQLKGTGFPIKSVENSLELDRGGDCTTLWMC